MKIFKTLNMISFFLLSTGLLVATNAQASNSPCDDSLFQNSQVGQEEKKLCYSFFPTNSNSNYQPDAFLTCKTAFANKNKLEYFKCLSLIENKQVNSNYLISNCSPTINQRDGKTASYWIFDCINKAINSDASTYLNNNRHCKYFVGLGTYGNEETRNSQDACLEKYADNNIKTNKYLTLHCYFQYEESNLPFPAKTQQLTTCLAQTEGIESVNLTKFIGDCERKEFENKKNIQNKTINFDAIGCMSTALINAKKSTKVSSSINPRSSTNATAPYNQQSDTGANAGK